MEEQPSNGVDIHVSIKNIKSIKDATKLRLNNGFKLQDLSIKTRLLARLPKSPNLKNVIQNINDIISMAQTADEAMQSIGSVIQVIQESLAGNGSNNPNDPKTQEYIRDLASEANRIVQETSFGNNNLLDGSFGFRTVKIGEDPKDTITFSMPDLRNWAKKLQKIDTISNNQEALTTIDSVLARVNSERSKMSVLLDRLINARYSQDHVVEHMGMRPAESLWSSWQAQQET